MSLAALLMGLEQAALAQAPTITNQPVGLTLAQGDTAVFTVGASGAATLTYQWFFNGATMAGRTASSLTLTNAQTTDSGTYTVRVANQSGSVTSAPAVLTVLIPPVITNPPQSVVAGIGSNVTFSVVAGGSEPLLYQWRFRDQNLPDQTNATLNLSNVQLSQRGEYRVRIANMVGGVESAGAFLIIPPFNDLCARAEVVPPSGPFPWLTSITEDITDATLTGDPPFPSCGIDVSRSIWYAFTPAQTALYGLSVSGDSATTVFDTVMAVYASQNGCNGPFIEVDCNDDSGLNRSALALTLDAGIQYYILVWNSEPSPLTPGDTAVQLRVSRPTVPVNDQCGGAITIPSSGPFPHLTPEVDTLLAAKAGDPPRPSCQVDFFLNRSVWFCFTPSQAGRYRFSTCSDTGTSVDDTEMTIYSSPSACSGPFTQVQCNNEDPRCDDFPVRAGIDVDLTAGTRYYIVVWDKLDVANIGETVVQLVVNLVVPEATTLPPLRITSTEVVVGGIVNSQGVLTRYWWQWGTTTNYGTDTAKPIILPGEVSVNSVTNDLSPFTGFAADTLYHYRLVATNDYGRANGADMTFRYTSAPAGLQITAGPGPGGLQLQFRGTSHGLAYRVFATARLDPPTTVWVDLGEATHLGGGIYQFTDPDTASYPERFYQIRGP